MEKVKIFAGTFRGFDMFIEVDPNIESPEKVKELYDKYCGGIRETEKYASEKRVEDDMNKFTRSL